MGKALSVPGRRGVHAEKICSGLKQSGVDDIDCTAIETNRFDHSSVASRCVPANLKSLISHREWSHLRSIYVCVLWYGKHCAFTSLNVIIQFVDMDAGDHPMPFVVQGDSSSAMSFRFMAAVVLGVLWHAAGRLRLLSESGKSNMTVGRASHRPLWRPPVPCLAECIRGRNPGKPKFYSRA